MDETYSLAQVRSMTAGSAPAADEAETFSLSQVRAMESAKQPSFNELMLKRETSDLSSNLRRGVKDVIDTGAEGLAYAWDKLTGADPAQGEYARVKSMNEAGRSEWKKANEGLILPHLQRIGGNALGTVPLTSALGAGVGAAGLPRLGSAISSAGMTTGGGAGRLADMATRMAGGGINGYVSAGMVDPEAANTGGVIGVATPPVLQGAHAAVRGARDAFNSRGGVGLAQEIAELGGANPGNLDELARMRDVLRQQGPSLIPGAEPTVPQILQTPGLSQLQRSVKAVNPGALGAREAEQSAARMEALNRIAPVSGTVQQAAEDAGNSIAAYAIPRRQAETSRVSQLFESVDPFGESRFTLPIDKMRAAEAKYLGPGTFGSGRDARSAIRTAEEIGQETLPAVRNLPASAGRTQSLEQAVRSLGGIRPNADYLGGEINSLRPRESGTTGLFSKSGKSADYVAQLMHERGFLPDSDPATLVEVLRNGGGRNVFAHDATEGGFQRMAEAAMGEAPGAATIAKPVSYGEVQNLRSSLNETWNNAKLRGNTREAAALQQMIRDLDSGVKAVSEGRGAPGDFFPPDMVATWKEALGAHAGKKLRFDTGPQASIFRQGGDGMPQIQGAEIPGKFFSSSRSQVENAQAFRRLVADDPRLMGDLQRYAITDAAGQVDRFGNLTNAKFNRWLDARSGATGEIFSEQQRAILKAIAEDLRRADMAENLGRSTGSDTAQKAANMIRLGLVDHPAAGWAASYIPGGQAVLGMLRRPFANARAEKIGGLLADPERMGGLLDTLITRQAQPQGLLGMAADPAMHRAFPLLYSQGAGGGGN